MLGDVDGRDGCVGERRSEEITGAKRQDSVTHQVWRLGERGGLTNLRGCVLGSGLDGASIAKVQIVEEKQV